MTDLTVRLRQYRAYMMAQHRLEQQLQTIEFVETVVKPKLEQLALEAGSTLEIPEFIIDNGDNTQN